MSESPFISQTGIDARNEPDKVPGLDPLLSRTNYYDGRLLKAQDLTRDQLYLDERLREVGRALGQGIVTGLEVDIGVEGELQVAPGLAIAPSGRALELPDPEPLTLNLYDSARLAGLNPGFRYFHGGLYVLALGYAQKGTGNAEAYPRDLESERGSHFNAFAEGVELSLVPLEVWHSMRVLDQRDPSVSRIAPRVALEYQLLPNAGQPPGLDDDSVALGLLSIERGRLQWFDRGLVRRPHRRPGSRYALQQDLHTHYEELLKEIVQMRAESGRQDAWPAQHYFGWLPPYGSLPAAAVDIEQGTQSYFPDGVNVSIAPVGEADLSAIIEQSQALEPIDLQHRHDMEVMVLAVLRDSEFIQRARQLGNHVAEAGGHRLLEHFDPLALRLFRRTPVFSPDSADASVWHAIMANSRRLLYVRRPTRVAETKVSAVVLASGYEAPPPGEDPAHDHSADDKIHSLEEQVAELKKDKKQLQKEIDDKLNKKLKDAQAKIEKQTKQLKDLKAQLAKAEAQGEQVTQLRKQRDKLQKQLEDANRQIKELESSGNQEAALRKRIDTLSGQLAKSQEAIKALRSQLANSVSAPISSLLKWRGVTDDNARNAARKLEAKIEGHPDQLGYIDRIALIVGGDHDDLLWPTLWQAEQTDKLAKLAGALAITTPGKPPAERMIAVLRKLKFPGSLVKQWEAEAARQITTPTHDTPGSPSINIPRRFLGGNAPFVDPIIQPGNENPLLNVTDLAKRAGITNQSKIKAVESRVGRSKARLKTLNQLMTHVHKPYRKVLWDSIPQLIAANQLNSFDKFVQEMNQKQLPLGLAVAASDTRFKRLAKERSAWAAVDLKG